MENLTVRVIVSPPKAQPMDVTWTYSAKFHDFSGVDWQEFFHTVQRATRESASSQVRIKPEGQA